MKKRNSTRKNNIFTRRWSLFPSHRGKKRRSAEGGRVALLLERGSFSRWLLGGIIFFITVLAISWRSVPAKLSVVEGQVSPRDIVAACDFSFVNEARTELARTTASSRQPFAYAVNPAVGEEKKSSLNKLFQRLESQTAAPADPRPPFSAAQISRLAGWSGFTELKSFCFSWLEKTYAKGILPSEVRETLVNTGQERILLVRRPGEEEIQEVSSLATPAVVREGLPAVLQREYPRKKELVRSLEEVFSGLLEPNLEYTRERTEELREKARRAIAPVITRINRGEKLVRQGEVIRPAHLFKLRAYQEERFRRQPPSSHFYRLFGAALLLFLFAIITIRVFKRYHPRIAASNSRLLMLSLIGLLVLVFARLIQQSSWYLAPRMLELTRYITPVPLGAMLFCLLSGIRVGIFLTLIISFLAAMVAGNDGGFLLVSWMGGMAAVFSIKGARKRVDIFRAGIIVGLVSLLTVIGLGAINGLPGPIFLKQGMGAALSGPIWAVIALIVLGLLESIFRIYSDIGLLELSDLNHPLLRQLMIKAPGTYHHSLMVGTLAEGAAEAIGANPLLVRIGSYFHDIGKIAKPEYFSENESGGVSRHQHLIPSMSSLIIISHVKDGVDLARKHHLDRRIVDIIQQHHGTSLVSYFYNLAEPSRQMKFDILEKVYRYPGPEPTGREAALVMLADSVEAASLTLKNPIPSRLEALVAKIIRDRFEDGQLDKCNLTMIQLSRIKEAFVRVLAARFHTRVKYPEGGGRKTEEGRRRSEDGKREE